MNEKKINGRVYRVPPVLATKAVVLQARVVRAIGPALEEVIALIPSPESQADSSAVAKAMLDAVVKVCENSDPEVLASLIRDMVDLSQIQRPSNQWHRTDMDGDLTQYPEDLLPLVAFVGESVFGAFFAGGRASGIAVGMGRAHG